MRYGHVLKDKWLRTLDSAANKSEVLEMGSVSNSFLDDRSQAIL